MGFFSSVQNTLSGATFGLVPYDTSNDATVKSVEERLSDLRKSGAYGSNNTESLQNTNLQTADSGYLSLLDLGSQLEQNKNSATSLSEDSLRSNEQAIAAQSQLAPVDYSQALRVGQDAYDQQRAQSIRDQAIIKATELQENASQLASVGSKLANQNSEAYNTNIFSQAGLESTRTANQSQVSLADMQAANRQSNALLGAGAAVAAAGINAFKNNANQNTGTGSNGAIVDYNNPAITPQPNTQDA